MLKKIMATRGLFQVFFLKQENDLVEVSEVTEVDLHEVQKHLESGESVFITSKQQPKIDAIINS